MSINVEYEEKLVTGDKAAAMELVKKTKQMGVPVIQIGEKYIVGFDKVKINETLKEAGLIK